MTYFVVSDPGEEVKHGEPVGFRLRHETIRMGLVLVPLVWVKFPKPMACPSCQIMHPFKTIHLHMEPDGTVLVSKGVLEHLQRAGLENHSLTLEGAVKNPPALSVKRGLSREAINNQNRAINLIGQQVGRVGNG